MFATPLKILKNPLCPKTIRVMLGETNPQASKPGTIRGDFCIDVGRNIIHASDSVEAAQNEIKMWFDEKELAGSWKPVQIGMVYEDEVDEDEEAGIKDFVRCFFYFLARRQFGTLTIRPRGFEFLFISL